MSDADQLLKAARIMAIAAATMARVEGMKAENEKRKADGVDQAYGEQAFFAEASALENESMHILNYG
jgi:hypothetical protein